MKRQLTIWFVLTGLLVFTIVACVPSSVTNPEKEPLYSPEQVEDVATSLPADEAEAAPTSVRPGTLPAITRESAENLVPATVVPEASISLPEEKIVTPPPPADQANKLTEDDFVQLAQEDLIQRLNISPGEVELVNYEEVQWRDSSLGCPQPKMQYLQVITPGYRIELNAQDQLYSYHGAAEQPPFLCVLTLGGKELPLPPDPADK